MSTPDMPILPGSRRLAAPGRHRTTGTRRLSPAPGLDPLCAPDELLPKDGDDSTDGQDPPPAYTPSSRPVISTRLAAALLASNPSLQRLPLHPPAVTFVRRPTSCVCPCTCNAWTSSRPVASPEAPRAEEEDDYRSRSRSSSRSSSESNPDLFPVHLRVSTRVNITRDANIVCLPSSTPSEQADAIAKVVLAAFKSSGGVEGGLPMVDRDGRPRPVCVEVDAGMTVEGASNIVGTEAAVLEVVRGRQAVMRQRMEMAGRGGGGGGVGVGGFSAGGLTSACGSGGSTPVRRRSAAEMGGQGLTDAHNGKRTRIEE